MTDRITNKWANNIEEAFGLDSRVRRGKEAEDRYFLWSKKNYDNVISWEKDQEKQNMGIDFTIFKKKWKSEGYTVDVKSNLKKKFFKIDNRPNGWLRHPEKKSDRIVHVDLERGWCVDYRREEMIKLLDSLNIPHEEHIVWNLFDPKMKEVAKKIIHMYNMNEVTVSDFIKE